MTDEKIKLIIGSLLHDIGKVVYREGDDRRNHSISGYDFLKENGGIDDKEILNCVRYHHISALKGAKLQENDLAYIVYLADNIAAFADRRKKEGEDVSGFDLSVPLQSIFNILNENDQEYYYLPGDMEDKGNVNYPTPEKRSFSKEFYMKIRQRVLDNFKGMDWNDEYLNSLLAVMESNLTYVPSSTSKGELSDISLFDHVKLTAAIASCMYDYLNENHLKYKEELLDKKDFYDKKAFLLCSMDISGIQKFIYTITSKNALRTLRARSFYLEIMMEHIIDLLLDKLELSRANLLYSGGGHCYLLLANTKKTVDRINEFQKELKEWLLEQFQIELYVAFGYVACTGNAFRNIPEGSYGQLFREMSKMLSEQKQHRYCAQDIIKLNHKKLRDYSRECRVCKRIGRVDDEGVCPLCRKIESLSKNVLYSEFFSVVLGNSEEKKGMPLPGGCYLVADTKESLSRRMEKDDHFVRAYSKNKMYTGKHIATKLWVGDYTTGDTFEEFAKKSKGINRIGVLRADVDSLAAIGAVDSPVVKDVKTNLPMIPGSSLKGKMRSLLAKEFNEQITEPKGDHERISRLFGSSEKNKIKRSRILFSDMVLANEQELREAGLQSMTEVKFENSISRLTAVANPRQIERAVRGSVFGLDLIYEMENEQEFIEDMQTLAEGMKLLQYDYLGGSGSRGYGKIQFNNVHAEGVIGNVDNILIDKCNEILKEVVDA